MMGFSVVERAMGASVRLQDPRVAMVPGVMKTPSQIGKKGINFLHGAYRNRKRQEFAAFFAVIPLAFTRQGLV
jgi:hypothetical protein